MTLAFSFSVFPAFTVFFPEILTFFTTPFMTLIVNVAFFPLPSVASAVIFTVFPPAFFLIVTTPFLSTVATFELLVIHFNVLFEAFFVMSAVNLIFFPAAIFVEIADSLIWLTFICCVCALDPCVGFCSGAGVGVGVGSGVDSGVGVGFGVGTNVSPL